MTIGYLTAVFYYTVITWTSASVAIEMIQCTSDNRILIASVASLSTVLVLLISSAKRVHSKRPRFIERVD